jgi:hypothetical protein
MAKTAIATSQRAWECKWSRPGIRLAELEEERQPESEWVCVRTGIRHPVTDERCEQCPYWQADDFRKN